MIQYTDYTNEELDEIVHDFKSSEATQINNRGRAAQLAYVSHTQDLGVELLRGITWDIDQISRRAVDGKVRQEEIWLLLSTIKARIMNALGGLQ